ncbi:unnamed protein product [Mytilus edulis]|uniref:Reverse transcriptase domain-containing protein n=1 Tax=Mytilus edulis TaxID=6550 RepID=A0A8S3S423_MYTED|nr:unnamed protein product [Mytilus edulis]
MQWKTLLIYLDDIIIYSSNLEDHFNKLDEILGRLQNVGLKLKPSKCEFIKDQVLYLGHTVSKNGISPNPKIVESVSKWQVPNLVKEVQQFLGLCNYYRQFVHKFSEIASPLSRLTRKDVPFNWSSECQSSFEILRKALCEASILAYPLPEGQFILDTDASNIGIGSVLSQIQNGKEKGVRNPECKNCKSMDADWVDFKTDVDNVTNLSDNPFVSKICAVTRTQNSKLIDSNWLRKRLQPTGESYQLLVPKVLRKEVMTSCHNTMYSAHFGVNKTKEKIKNCFHWYKMGEDIQSHVNTCSVCNRFKALNRKPKASLQSYTVEVCKLLEIHKTRSTSYRPCSNGIIERFNATLEGMIRSFVNKNANDWDLHIGILMAAYRSTVHPATETVHHDKLKKYQSDDVPAWAVAVQKGIKMSEIYNCNGLTVCTKEIRGIQFGIYYLAMYRKTRFHSIATFVTFREIQEEIWTDISYLISHLEKMEELGIQSSNNCIIKSANPYFVKLGTDTSCDATYKDQSYSYRSRRINRNQER